MKLILESDSLEITEYDKRLANEVLNDFYPLIEKYRNYYATVFFNKGNRKFIFKVSGGIIRNARIEKIDEGEE